MTVPSLGLILISVLLGVLGQLAMKQGMLILADQVEMSLAFLFRMLFQPYVFVGLSLYAVSAISWLIVLSRVPLSQAYPMLSIGYILVAILSWWLFSESLTAVRFLGILLISLGVIFVSRS